MYIVDNTDEDRQTDSQETVHGVAVKTECSEDSEPEDAVEQEINENSNTDCFSEEFHEDLIKYESAVFTCTVCCEQFPHKHACIAHVCTHLHDENSPFAIANSGNGPFDTTQHTERALATSSGASHNPAPDTDHTTNNLKSCVVVLYDILKYPQNAKIKVEPSQTLRAVSPHDHHTACEDVQYAASEDEVAATHKEPAASVPSETEPGTSGHISRRLTFICDVCERAFTRIDHIVTHIKSHSIEKPYSCDICSYKCTAKSYLDTHIRSHTGERPYPCKICSYSYKQKGDLTRHMKKHSGEKPYSCEICGYQCTRKYDLMLHKKKHTSEKPYSCKICHYKFKRKAHLLRHMSTHTGETPYSCKLCDCKFTLYNSLLRHNVRKHSGEEPYSCTICSYKCKQKSSLVHHMKTHSGEKPYTC